MAAGDSGSRLHVLLQLRACAGLAATLAAAAALLYWVTVTVLLPHWLAALVIGAAAEAAFYGVLWRRKHAQLNAIPDSHEPPDHDGWSFFERWHASSHYNVRFLAIAELIKCWFANVPTMEIRRGNLTELVARGYFYKSLEQLEADGKAHLVEAMLQAMESVWGYRFEDGVNPELTYLDHLQEPLKVSYRPLAFYAACEFGAALKHAALLAAGFRGHTYGPYTYYTYGLPTAREAELGRCAGSRPTQQQEALGPQSQSQPQSQHQPEGLPLVFLHGVGAGLLPYIPFLLRLTSMGRPVMAVEYKHLSMRWTDFIPTAPQVAADMKCMFDRHGIDRAALVAHSYGTFYVSCLLKLAPEKVACMALVDPVCCCMWSGHLISNFVYSPARSTTGLITWLIARDIHTATAVSRNFFWTDVNLWPDEIPARSVVVLSDKDDLVPVQHVGIMLAHEAPGVALMRLPGAHADFLFSPKQQGDILGMVEEMMQQQQRDDEQAACAHQASAPQPQPQPHISSSSPVMPGSQPAAAAAAAGSKAVGGGGSSSGGAHGLLVPGLLAAPAAGLSPAAAAAGAAGGAKGQAGGPTAIAAADTAAEDLACFKDAVQTLRYGLRSHGKDGGSGGGGGNGGAGSGWWKKQKEAAVRLRPRAQQRDHDDNDDDDTAAAGAGAPDQQRRLRGEGELVVAY